MILGIFKADISLAHVTARRYVHLSSITCATNREMECDVRSGGVGRNVDIDVVDICDLACFDRTVIVYISVDLTSTYAAPLLSPPVSYPAHSCLRFHSL